MLLVLSAALAVLHSAPLAQSSDTTRTDAYADPQAQQLVERARQRRARVESGIEGYQVLARRRIYAGMRVMGRNRTLYTQETAARVHWRREGQGEVHLLGAREGVPVSQREAQLPDDVIGPGSDIVELAFDPDRIQLGLSMHVSVQRDSSARSGDVAITDPLAPGSEAHYRFAAGDSVSLRMQGGRVIQLRELKLTPRRADYRLLRGSLWLDSESYGVVRGVFTMARPFDLVRDADGDIPGAVRAMGAIRARLDRMTMEYGLVQGRWWLPHRIYLDATAEAGVLGTYPVRFEQSYASYRVQGTGEPELPAFPRDAMAMSSDSVHHCESRSQRCRDWRVLAPRDTVALLESEELQPSLAEAGEVMATDRELADLGRVLQGVTGIGVDPTPRLDMPDLSSFRFNRVEGPSFGALAGVGAGRFLLDGRARIGVADWEPSAELGITRPTLRSETRLAGYRRLVPFDLYAAPATFGSALNALVLGRDETDYLRATGVELAGRPIRAARWETAWRLFGEHQHPVGRETDLSLTRAWDDDPFPEVRPAQRADQYGAVVTLRTATDDPYGRSRRDLLLTLDGQAGTFQFARASASAGIAIPVGGLLDLSLGASAGTSAGDVPVQGLWYLGGPASVRGFRTAHVGGEAFWRARAEVARGQPSFRLALFGDAGWAGDRDRNELDPSLVSAGAGISTMDGLIRLDLSRALRGGDDWRVDLYLNGAF